jgi:hypothetical protein
VTFLPFAHGRFLQLSSFVGIACSASLAASFRRPRTLDSYDIAIFGDSYADAYTPAMNLLAKEAGLSRRQITIGRCFALVGY